MTTPILAMDEISQNQALAHVTHNQSIRILEIIAAGIVKDKDLSTPPSHNDGDMYIISSSPTGAWSGNENKLALSVLGSWQIITPETGYVFYVADEAKQYTYTGSAWIELTVTASAPAINPHTVAATELDYTNGSYQTKTVTSNQTFTFAGFTNNQVEIITFEVKQDGSGDHDISFTGVTWHNDVVPTANKTANKTNIYQFISRDGGTTVFGRLLGSGEGGGSPSEGTSNTFYEMDSSDTEIDFENGNHQLLELTENKTLTFTNIPGLGEVFQLRFSVRQDLTGSHTVDFPEDVLWSEGSAPTISTAASSLDMFEFISYDGGFNTIGRVLCQNIPIADIDDAVDILLYEYDLIAHYKLQEETGTTLFDSSGNGLDATVSSLGVTTPVIGDKSAISSETDDTITFPIGTQSSTDITVILWVRLSSFINDNSTHTITFDTASQTTALKFRFQSNKFFNLTDTGGAAGSDFSGRPSNIISTDQPLMVGFSRLASGGCKIFVNGTVVSNANNVGDIGDLINMKLINVQDSRFDAFQKLSFINEVISNSDILDIYNTGIGL